MELYPHNILAYQKLTESLKLNQKACVIQPTGTGKSYIIAKLIQDHPDKNFLLLTSSSYIINQFDQNFKSILDNYDSFAYPGLISMKFHELLLKEYHYIILDEFHRAGAEIWGKRLTKLFNHFFNAKVIGFTATHLRNDYNEDGILRNMADELFANNVVHFLSVFEAFDTGILPSPKYITALYNLSDEYTSALNRIKKLKPSNELELKNTLLELKLNWENSKGVENIIKKHISFERNFIVFSENLKKLKKLKPIVINWFKNSFNQPVKTYDVYSELPNSSDNLISFINNSTKSNEDFNLVFAINQLNEGIHVPNIHGILLLRSTKSHIIYFQQLGRVLETGMKQPLVFDLVNNFKNNKTILKILHKRDNYQKSIPDSISKQYLDFKRSFTVIDEVKQYTDIFDAIYLDVNLFNVNINILKEKLISGVTFSSKDKSFIRRIKLLYKNNKLSDSQLNLISSLNIFLGDNWYVINNLTVTLEQKVSKIISNFKQHPELINKPNKVVNEIRSGFVKKLDKYISNEELFKSLNPYLGENWYSSLKVKNIEDIVSDFLTSLSKNSPINLEHKRFISKVRYMYINNIYNYKSKASLFELLVPYFGKDWYKEQQNPIEKNCLSLKESYQNKIKLNYSQNSFLKRIKHLYNKNKLDEISIQYLSILDPYLGPQWYKNNYFLQHQNKLQEVACILSTNQKLNPKQTNMLARYKTLYKKGELSPEYIEVLKILNPYLGDNWYKTSLFISFEDRIQMIKQTLIDKQPLSKPQREFISSYTVKYNNNTISDSQLELLNTLDIYLGKHWYSIINIRTK